MELTPIGTVESSITSLDDSPRQGDEGAPDAYLVDIKPVLRDSDER